MRGRQGFCAFTLLVGVLVAILVVAFMEADLFEPSSPPMQVKSELDAWKQALAFLRPRLETPDKTRLPVYNPASVTQVTADTWEVTVTVEILDEYGVRTARRSYRILEKWAGQAGWTLLEMSLVP